MNTTMSEVSLDQLKTEIRGNIYNIISDDVNAVSIRFERALLEVNMDNGNDGQLVIFKPGTFCEVVLDSDSIIEDILANADYSEIIIRFKNGMSDLSITLCKE